MAYRGKYPERVKSCREIGPDDHSLKGPLALMILNDGRRFHIRSGNKYHAGYAICGEEFARIKRGGWYDIEPAPEEPKAARKPVLTFEYRGVTVFRNTSPGSALRWSGGGYAADTQEGIRRLIREGR